MQPITTNPYRIDKNAYLMAMWCRALLKLVGLMLALDCVELLILQAIPKHLSTNSMTFTGVILICINFTLLPLRYVMMWRNVFHKPSSLFIDTITLQLDSEGYTVSTVGGMTGRVPWTYIRSAERSKGFLLLFQNKILHNPIPESSFATKADLEALLRFLQEKGLLKELNQFGTYHS